MGQASSGIESSKRGWPLSRWIFLGFAVIAGYYLVTHPQYDAFMLIMLGFLIQWPTILTLAMFPLLVLMYMRLARSEERDAVEQFGDEYRRYAAATPAFIPRLDGALPEDEAASILNPHATGGPDHD